MLFLYPSSTFVDGDYKTMINMIQSIHIYLEELLIITFSIECLAHFLPEQKQSTEHSVEPCE